jgi:hypothetical protein
MAHMTGVLRAGGLIRPVDRPADSLAPDEKLLGMLFSLRTRVDASLGNKTEQWSEPETIGLGTIKANRSG